MPALEHGEVQLCETGAIALYLAETFPSLNLLIGAGDPARPAFLQWLHYLATTLQPSWSSSIRRITFLIVATRSSS